MTQTSPTPTERGLSGGKIALIIVGPRLVPILAPAGFIGWMAWDDYNRVWRVHAKPNADRLVPFPTGDAPLAILDLKLNASKRFDYYEPYEFGPQVIFLRETADYWDGEFKGAGWSAPRRQGVWERSDRGRVWAGIQ